MSAVATEHFFFKETKVKAFTEKRERDRQREKHKRSPVWFCVVIIMNIYQESHLSRFICVP